MTKTMTKMIVAVGLASNVSTLAPSTTRLTGFRNGHDSAHAESAE